MRIKMVAESVDAATACSQEQTVIKTKIQKDYTAVKNKIKQHFENTRDLLISLEYFFLISCEYYILVQDKNGQVYFIQRIQITFSSYLDRDRAKERT